ncbi:Kef-type potassium/proton antiporter, CPA2 family (TC 2.A.37.1) [Paracoccus aminovorans]|uniref:Kef-type potassium/proton antiporter, CPA2 family (TC 2.A.37.1) n=1 Tax=Paracoccus aminovorans TaxID=34004 RepID=A0A1I2YFE8_9RHOB|nr:monovalent cation:proton antiporter-2 (CPA2) family protein [Paracoccus aminovorans]CQR86636.1 glutathione-regulated potassium-efflux system protein [Paracoccus aminovorans]SFH24059.1 Kef-type potassium/proton antiporter, CPA2 family (TC 2.A.37.1) [Paracoccus aminovorans]
METFLLIATVYLLTMVIAVPLSARLGLGSVLGYLVAGIVIGPVLGVAGSAGEMADLQHFAEFGVVMMLFLIGLELEPEALWQMRKKLLGLAGMQILGTVALLALMAMAFNQDWHVAVTLGMILSLSSTAIVLQTLSEKSLMQTPGGRSAFAVLLTQDIAVIPMLALMPLLATRAPLAEAQEHIGEAFMHSLPGWAAALVTLGAVAAVILMGQYLIRPLFRYVYSARLNELDTALALLIVVGIASLMEFVGLSPALGTFLAGVMLAGSEFRHELEGQIAPFKGLLLGIFFITVGAGMNFQILFERPATVLGVTVVLIAVKAMVLHMIARLTGLRGRDRTLFTLSLAQAGEFGFVLISYAVSLAILPRPLAQGFLLVIALSMLATPLLFILSDFISRRIAEERASDIADEIAEQQPIIIAGVGRFGQVLNRLVTMSGFKTTVLDHDLEVIQLMRRFGFKGYFGDPTRPEILMAAGLDKAKVLVAALDDPEANLRLIRYAKEKRPDIVVIARARDRVNVFQLYAAKADHIVRETFDSSLRAGRYALEHVGLSPYEAAELERIFYRMDRAHLRELAEVWKPDVPMEENRDYMGLSRDLNRQLESALMERFAHGPSAAPIAAGDDEAPEHGLTRPGRPGGR